MQQELTTEFCIRIILDWTLPLFVVFVIASLAAAGCYLEIVSSVAARVRAAVVAWEFPGGFGCVGCAAGTVRALVYPESGW